MESPRPFLHLTDLYRPAIDPDDHWDLACVFALAQQRAIDVQGVIIDFTPPDYPGRSPDVLGVMQLAYLARATPRLAVGSPIPFSKNSVDDSSSNEETMRGAKAILDILKQAASPVVITVVGSCRDIAAAAIVDPTLFAEKCAALYLNAGSGTPDPLLAQDLEYNVKLNPEAYGAVFSIPCPIYWMPCFEDFTAPDRVREYGTWYAFRQSEILPDLPPALQAFFTGILEGRTDSNYLERILHPEREVASPYIGRADRSMWCTAGFFHAVGSTVTRSGDIVPVQSVSDESVFRFEPITVDCDPDGVTTWRPDPTSTQRFIFRVTDTEAYASAMTTAMKSLLAGFA